MQPSAALEERQRTLAALLVLPRFDTIRVEPRFDPHAEPADFVEPETGSSVDQELLALGRAPGPGSDATPL